MVAERKSVPTSSPRRSQVNQCMSCHGNPKWVEADAAASRQSPTVVYSGRWPANARQDLARAGGECGPGSRDGLEPRFLPGRTKSGDWPASNRPAAVDPSGRGPGRRGDTVWFSHPVGYRSVAFSSTGRTLAAGIFDGTLSGVRSWRRSGKCTTAKTRARPSMRWHVYPAAPRSPPGDGRLGPVPRADPPLTVARSSIRARSGASPSVRTVDAGSRR